MQNTAPSIDLTGSDMVFISLNLLMIAQSKQQIKDNSTGHLLAISDK